MTDVFKAISDPTRRKILLLLAQQPSSINSISEQFQMSRPAISKHIKILQASELVGISQDQQDGRQRNCYIQLKALSEVNDYINQLEKFWKRKLDGLGDFLEQQK